LFLPSVNVQINFVHHDFRTWFNYICKENKTDAMIRDEIKLVIFIDYEIIEQVNSFNY